MLSSLNDFRISLWSEDLVTELPQGQAWLAPGNEL
jgi:hypothetical protein